MTITEGRDDESPAASENTLESRLWNAPRAIRQEYGMAYIHLTSATTNLTHA